MGTQFQRPGQERPRVHRLAGICMLGIIFPAVACAEPLTLSQCIARGLAFNPEIRAYQLAVKAAGEGINEARGDFLPTLSLNYGHAQLSGGASDERDADYFDQQSGSFSVRLSQPLFSGLSGVAALKKAGQSKRYREYELQYVQHQLVREIRTSYFDLMLARQLVAKWQESVERLEKQRLIAKAWVDVELEPRIRLLEVEVELADARQQLISAEAGRAKALARMEELLAMDLDDDAVFAGSLEEVAPAPCEEVASCLDKALQQRPELGMAALNIDMARQDAKAIVARNLPHADLEASWNDYRRDYDAGELNDERRNYYNVMLNLSVRPFQGGRNLSAWRQQRINIERLHSQQDKLRHEIAAEVKVHIAQLRESRGRKTAANDGLAQAREAYQVASRSVEVGVASLKDLLTAELLLTRAEINRIHADHALQKAHLQLDYIIGNE